LSGAFFVLTLIGEISGSTSLLWSAENRVVPLHAAFSRYTTKYAMDGYVSRVRSSSADLAFDVTQVMQEKKNCTPLMLDRTSSKSSLFDAIWFWASSTSSRHTRQTALHDTALQSSDI
jgi:hypothetical protein